MNKNVKTILAMVTLGLFCLAQTGFAVTKTVPPGGKTPPVATPAPAPAPAPAPMPQKPHK